jgi:hypothetical protein
VMNDRGDGATENQPGDQGSEASTGQGDEKLTEVMLADGRKPFSYSAFSRGELVHVHSCSTQTTI